MRVAHPDGRLGSISLERDSPAWNEHMRNVWKTGPFHFAFLWHGRTDPTGCEKVSLPRSSHHLPDLSVETPLLCCPRTTSGEAKSPPRGPQ